MLHTSPNLGPGPDPAARVAPLRRAHERFVHTGDAVGVRTVVADSWRRCRDGGVDPGRTTAPVLDAAELRSHRERSPLVELLPLFRELLGRIATEARHLMAVGDAGARLLWVEGHPVLRRQAEHMNFVEGAAWDERAAGTNAPGTAIALNRPVQIAAAEHFCEVVQPWTCSAAPIRDPHTRDVLGFVDLTGGDQLGTPISLSLVRAIALAAEGSWPGYGRLDRRVPRCTPPAPVRPVLLTSSSWAGTRRSSVSASSNCGCPAGTARSSRCSRRGPKG